MAEALFKKYITGDYTVSSAGTKLSGEECSLSELPLIENVLIVMQEEGIDVSKCRRKQLTQEMFDTADKVFLVVDKNDPVPDFVKGDKVVRWNVPDPKGTTLERHREILNKIKKLVLSISFKQKNTSVFSDLGDNIIALYNGRNLLWQLAFFLLTYICVATGFDYFYYQSTRNPTLLSISFGAAFLGFLVPVFLPLGMYIYAKIKKSIRVLNATWAVIQAGALGLAISSFYKIFTGRVGPMRASLTTDLTHMFRFGILKGGAFQGWPSSHTSVAFAMSMALVTLFPENKVVKYSALIYAIYIGLGVSTTIHWFSDFAAGLILGAIIGITVGKSFLKKQNI